MQKPKFRPIKKALDYRSMLQYKYITLKPLPYHNFGVVVAET